MQRNDKDRPFRRAAFEALARERLVLEVQFADRQAADAAVDILDDRNVRYTVLDGAGWEAVPPKLTFKFPDVINLEQARRVLQ